MIFTVNGTISLSQNNIHLIRLFRYDSIDSETQVEFFSLDRNSGQLQLVATSPKYINSIIYGIEFSSNGQYVYFNLTNYLTWNSKILQIKLVNNIPDFSNIQTIAQFNYPYYNMLRSGSLQIAIDGKIYISMISNYLSVINNPNNFGSSCNFSLNAINLSPKSSIEGLPTLFQTFSFTNTIVVNGDNCSKIRNFITQNYSNINNLVWNFGDNQISTELEPTHIYTNAGTYTVTLEVTFIDNSIQTITKTIEIFDSPIQITIEHE